MEKSFTSAPSAHDPTENFPSVATRMRTNIESFLLSNKKKAYNKGSEARSKERHEKFVSDAKSDAPTNFSDSLGFSRASRASQVDVERIFFAFRGKALVIRIS